MSSVWYHFFIFVSLYEFLYPLTIVEALILYQKISKDVYTKNIVILSVSLHHRSQCRGFIENSLLSPEFLLNYEWGFIYKKKMLIWSIEYIQTLHKLTYLKKVNIKELETWSSFGLGTSEKAFNLGYLKL